MPGPAPQSLTAAQLSAAEPAVQTPPRPSPLARASSLFQQVHLPPAPSFAAHFGSATSPDGTRQGGFHFDLPTLKVPDAMRFPEFDLPKLELGPAWAGFRARFQQHHEQAELPPMPELVLEGYEPRGEWKQMGDWRVYIVGPDPSLDCIIGAYDIFGPTLQTIQGADILHHLTGSTVYVPDFFHGRPFPAAHFPPETAAQVRELQTFFEGEANIDDSRDALVAFGTALRERFRRREGEEESAGEGTDDDGDGGGAPRREDSWERWVRVGCYGISWGGKLTFLAGSGSSPFYAVASVTPAMMTLLDAEALKVPLGLFLSRDEPVDVGERIVDLLRWKTFSSKCEVRTWADMPHGFPGARGDLRTPAVAQAYLELYAALARFFRATQRLDHTSLPIGSPTRATAGAADEPRAVEDDVGREGVGKNETVESKVEDRRKGKRGWFGRRRKATEG